MVRERKDQRPGMCQGRALEISRDFLGVCSIRVACSNCPTSPWPQNIGKSMSCQEFITNLNGLKDGGNFPKDLLKVRLPVFSVCSLEPSSSKGKLVLTHGLDERSL